MKAIQETRIVFRKTHEIKEDLNKIFGCNLVLIITAIFVELVYFVFIRITIAKDKGNTKLPDMKLGQIQSRIWVMIMKLLACTFICQLVAEKFKKTGVFVHGLFQETEDPHVRNEVSSN